MCLLDLLAERVLALRRAHPIRVGIDGRSAAGKSTFARGLAGRIRAADRAAHVCNLDDFHPPGHKHRAAAGYFDSLDKYLADGYDFASFRRLAVDPAGPGGSRRCRLTMWKSFEDEPYPERWVTLDDDAVLVAEGGFLFLPEFRSSWDFTIWLDIDNQTLLDRVTSRDVWVGDAQQIRERYQRGWIPRHEQYEALYHPQEYADAVVDNRRPERPLDGFGTGEGQRLDAPFGHAEGRLLEWFFATRTFHAMQREPGGSTGVDDAFASNWGPGIGAEIMGRNKFGPQRGPWADQEWKGWWGDDPVFHTPVFVLTHHRRPAIEMNGGTTFHFIDATPAQALAVAKQAAGGQDIRTGGGPSTIRQFLAADLIDHMHIVVVPIVLGRGERAWDGLEGLEQRFDVESVSSPSGVTHLTYTRR